MTGRNYLDPHLRIEQKNATTLTEAHALLMDLFCEVENPAAAGCPLCEHVIYGSPNEDCPMCQLWDSIRTYAKKLQSKR